MDVLPIPVPPIEVEPLAGGSFEFWRWPRTGGAWASSIALGVTTMILVMVLAF